MTDCGWVRVGGGVGGGLWGKVLSHHPRMIASVMIMISLCSYTLVKFDMEGEGWNVWGAVALWLKSLRVGGRNGWGYVESKLWT